MERSSRYNCAQNRFPEIDFNNNSNTQNWNVFFDSGSTDYIFDKANSSDPTQIRFVKGYQFNVPSVPQQDLWQFYCEIGFDFINSGSIGVVLMPNLTTPTSLCGEEEGCSFGVSDRLNFKTINALIGEGNYTLWIFEMVGLSNGELSQCNPFSFKLSITPLQKVESFLTCDAALLPTHFEAPGLVESNSTNKYFLYTEDVLVSSSRNTVHFTIDQRSYFRVWVEGHRLDLDVYLINANSEVIFYSFVRFFLFLFCFF